MNRDEALVIARAEEAALGQRYADRLSAEGRKMPRAERRRLARAAKKIEQGFTAIGADTIEVRSGLVEMLLIAARRRNVRWCSHERLPDPERGFVIDLGHRRGECMACYLAHPPLQPAADGRCDVCDGPVPENYYHELVVAVGTTMIHGNACAECSAHIDSFRPGATEPKR